MAYANTRELKEDVLFRAGESISGISDYETKVIHYLNRVYRTLCSGASEFLPEYIEDWWWLRGEGVLQLETVFSDGTVQVTLGSTNITFTNPPAFSLTGYRLKVSGQSPTPIPIISSHSPGSINASIDADWTGDTNNTANFQAMKLVYDLSSSVQVILSPMNMFENGPVRINGVSPERMDELWPIGRLQSGIPQLFALANDRQVRFSHGGPIDGLPRRIEYRYRPKIADLIDSTSSIPVVPEEWRHVMADMALTYVLMDKNDDRSNAVALAARTGLAAMLKENRRRNVKIDSSVGHLFPRGKGASKRQTL